MTLHPRVLAALVWTLVFIVLALPLAGCARSAGSSTSTSSPPAVTLAPSAAASGLARTDPAVWAAVRFEQAHCSWDWRRPLGVYVAAQQQLATPAYGQQIAATADPVSWRQEVVVGQQQVTCTVSQAHRLVGAPSTSSTVYVRMSVAEQVTSTLGDFAGGDKITSWLVQRVAGRWLVAGTFDGG